MSKNRSQVIVLITLVIASIIANGQNLQVEILQLQPMQTVPLIRDLQNQLTSLSSDTQAQATNVVDQVYVQNPANSPLQFGTLPNSIESQPQQNQQVLPSQTINQQQIIQQTTINDPITEKPEPKMLEGVVDKLIIGKGFKSDSGISSQRIRIDQIKGKFLFFYFSLDQNDKWQKVNITLTSEESSTVLRKCQYDGSDSCFIPKQFLKQNQVIDIEIQCQDQCTYHLNAHWSNLEHLYPGDQLVFMFGHDKTQIYHLELKEDQIFEELRIQLAPRVTRRPFDNVKIYGKYGSEDVAPTPQNYDFKSVNLWQDGEGIFLTRQALKGKKIMLLVIGQAQTTYRLTCQLIKTNTHQIDNDERVYEYLDAGSSKSFKVSFDTKRYDEFSLRFSTLSGELNVTYFVDADMKIPFAPRPFEYMKDSQYIFYSVQIADFFKDGLYMKVSGDKRDATFAIKFVSRKQSESVELNEHVYGFIPILNVKFAHFNFKRWAMETQQRSNLKFTVSVIKVIGIVSAQFRVCKSTLSQCTNPDLYQNTTIPISSKPHSDVSQKEIYELQIQDSVLTKINIAQQQAVIIVRLLKTDTQIRMHNLVALQFLNNNKILYLREGRPFEEKLSHHETKIYKYINSDPNVQEIRVHLNQIAGHVKFKGQVISEDGSGSILVQPESNTLRFTHNLTQTILVAVAADSNSIFGISMQIIHKNEVTEQANVISISEDLAYTVKIQPNSFSVFEVTPIFYEFSFSYTSSQSVIACVVNLANQCVSFNGTELTTPKLSFKGEITEAILQNRKGRVKIVNPFGDSIAQVTVIFHSRRFGHCDRKKIGRVYSEVAKEGSCFSYLLEQKSTKTLDIYISKRQFVTLAYSILLCGNSIRDAFKTRELHITPDLVDTLCSNSVEIRQISIIWSVTSKNDTKEEKQINVDFVAQYTGDLILLPEGISYNVQERSKEGVLKKFAFNVINKKDTKIIINQIRGKFRAYAKVISESQNDQIQISEISYDYSSSNTLDFSQEPIIIVPGKDFQKIGCIDCSIKIAVYSLEDIGKQIEFQIEVVQRFQSLNDNNAVQGYLEAKSVAYYFYVTSQEHEITLAFIISDHNQQCANMFLDTSEYPSEKSHIANVRGGNQMLYRHKGGQKKYFLSVEATKLCDYTISVKTIQSVITRLERGKQNNVKLRKDKIKYFIFEHFTTQPFKVISLTKYGEVRMYLNISTNQPQSKLLTAKELQLSQFAYKSEELNILSVNEGHPLFCQNCNYFLAVQALKNTETTLYLAYSQTTIPIVLGKVFSDFIAKKNDYTLASYNNLEQTQLQIKVHQGEVSIQISYKEVQLKQTFTAKQETQYMTIDVLSNLKQTSAVGDSNIGLPNNLPMTIERIPINLMIIAKADHSSYSLQMNSLDNKDGVSSSLAVYQSVTAGQPNHIEISSSKVLCLTGYLRDKNEELIITTNSDNQKKLNSLIMEAKLNNQKAEITKSYIRNILTLNFAFPTDEESVQFQLCLKLQLPESTATQPAIESSQNQLDEQTQEVTLKAILSQSNSVNILPSDTETVVKGSSMFVVHSDGEFLLDVFQCAGEAKINYGNSLKNIQKSKMKMLDLVGMSEQKHAVKIVQNATTFVQINSEYSIVRWFPIDIESDQGTGYLKYKTGDLKYSSHFKFLNIEFQPLQALKKSKSKVKEIEYFLYFSNMTDKIQMVTQCDVSEVEGVKTMSLGVFDVAKSKQKQYITYTIEKQFLENEFQFSNNIYFSMAAKMTMQVSPKIEKDTRFSTPISDQHQHYRFIYSRQQVPLQSYQQNQIESLPYKYLLISIASLALLIIMCYYLFSRKIVPLISRLRTSNLVEQQAGQHKDDLQVPASSDRNRRMPDVAIQTQDQMDK